MKIKLSPCRMDEKLEARVSGDTLTLNGESFDFAQLQEGDLLPQSAVNCRWLASSVERVDGVICLTILLPHGARAPQETLFPENFDTYLTVESGPVPIPAYEVDHD